VSLLRAARSRVWRRVRTAGGVRGGVAGSCELPVLASTADEAYLFSISASCASSCSMCALALQTLLALGLRPPPPVALLAVSAAMLLPCSHGCCFRGAGSSYLWNSS
jgi:hypothetical protein